MKLGLAAVATCCLVHLGLVGGLIAGAVPALAAVAVAVAVAVAALSRHRRGSRAHCC